MAHELGVAQDLFASMLEAWRNGFVQIINEINSMPPAEVEDCFANMIEPVRDPRRYAAWLVPVLSARVGGRLE